MLLVGDQQVLDLEGRHLAHHHRVSAARGDDDVFQLIIVIDFEESHLPDLLGIRLGLREADHIAPVDRDVIPRGCNGLAVETDNREFTSRDGLDSLDRILKHQIRQHLSPS